MDRSSNSHSHSRSSTTTSQFTQSSMADQLISTAVHEELPESYVRPEAQRPRLHEVVSDAQIPVVDLADPDPAAVVASIGEACTTHGFFQVLNHGVPVELMDSMLAVAYEFFQLPAEEKAKLYSDDPAKKMRLSTSFNLRKETGNNLLLTGSSANPPSFREMVGAIEVREPGLRLNAMISESLGLDEGFIKTTTLGEQEQHMAVNFYPKCPEPELTYGLPGRTDPNALTILLMDQQTAGLQVLKQGRWITVNPQPNALVVNIRGQLQVMHESEVSESNELVINNIGDDLLQVCVAKGTGAKAGDPIDVGSKANPGKTGSDNDDRRGRGVRILSAVMAIIAASSAVNGIAGSGVNPAVAFVSLLAFLGAMILASASVCEA